MIQGDPGLGGYGYMGPSGKSAHVPPDEIRQMEAQPFGDQRGSRQSFDARWRVWAYSPRGNLTIVVVAVAFVVTVLLAIAIALSQ